MCKKLTAFFLSVLLSFMPMLSIAAEMRDESIPPAEIITFEEPIEETDLPLYDEITVPEPEPDQEPPQETEPAQEPEPTQEAFPPQEQEPVYYPPEEPAYIPQQDAPIIDTTRSALYSPDFTAGWVAIARGAEVFATPGAEAYAAVSGGIGYAFSRIYAGTQYDSLLVGFAAGNNVQLQYAYIPAEGLRPMADDEIEYYRLECAAIAEEDPIAVFYQQEDVPHEWPFLALKLTYIEEAAETAPDAGEAETETPEEGETETELPEESEIITETPEEGETEVETPEESETETETPEEGDTETETPEEDEITTEMPEEGEIEIEVPEQVEDEASETAEVTPTIILNDRWVQMTVGETYGLIYSIFPTDAEPFELVWVSGNEEIVSVEAGETEVSEGGSMFSVPAGIITANSAGIVGITVRNAENADIAEVCVVEVLPQSDDEPEEPAIMLSKDSIKLYVGQTYELSSFILCEDGEYVEPFELEWISSDTRIATVEVIDADIENIEVINDVEAAAEIIGTGMITALSAGSAEITIRSVKDEENNAVFMVEVLDVKSEIYTREDLDAIRHKLDGTYTLMNDIDLRSIEWTPIGN